ncbi:MAG: hypothetical protein HOG68_04855 [Candidatus Marinimicrobia bacterium]|nr:hypothetical protein [Candidatus Neomarinimicrobiota bacterium]
MKKFRLLLSVFLVLVLTDSASSVTRVAYTRPGLMMKIPASRVGQLPYLFRVGFGSEIHNFSNFNSVKGVYFDMGLGKNFILGFSSSQGADTTSLANLDVSTYTPPVEFGFHFQQRVYTYNNVSFSIGMHDVVFENQDKGGLALDPDQLSFFGVVSSEKQLGTYAMSTFIGFGTGGFAAQDTLSALDTSQTSGRGAGVFAGFILNTPFMQNWGGIDLVGEFDGTGINVGLRIPLTSDYRLNLGFTHIEKLPDWNKRYWNGHPGWTIGLDMSVPRGLSRAAPIDGPSPLTSASVEYGTQFDSTLMEADYAVHSLRDSMSMMTNEMRNLIIRLSAMDQKSKFLEDSLSSIKLSKNVDEQHMNEAMRHLSRSLRYFYSGDYREALQEVDLALDLRPDLALAYARRGSIYYKLGDIQRATINWNLALRLDPEYDDVRNVLKALHENRLKSTSFLED